MSRLRSPQIESSLAKQPSDVRLLPDHERNGLIISTIRVDGTWVIKSHYGDDVWHLTGGATNKGRSKKLIDFSRAPAVFRSVLKEVMYRYLQRGRDGQARPAVQTIVEAHKDVLAFLCYLDKLKLRHLGEVTPLVCSTYVAAAKAEPHRYKKDRLLSASTLENKFKAVEMLYELSQFTATPMPLYPWPDSSAWQLSGKFRNGRRSKTPLIPDDEFSRIFSEAHALVERGDQILDLRDALASIAESRHGQDRKTIHKAKRNHLEYCGWKGGLKSFAITQTELRIACYIVVASLSGCRNHELAYVQSGACYSTADEYGETYWWMKSRSDKLGTGKTEWMVPEAAVNALRLMDRWAVPYQSIIAEEIDRRRTENPQDPEIAEAQRHAAAVFLGIDKKKGNGIRTLSDGRWNWLLVRFARARGVNWRFATHQFRRKFANYAARSQFGDLRYLREHFKHWSQDMTNDSYALNDSQEIELYEEIQDELDGIKLGLAEQWLSPNEALAGGYGKSLMDWRRREENIILFKDRAAMVKSVADSHAIRSNGHAWCTADDKQCIGNTFEKTRCSGCNNAVIGRAHARIYQNLYTDLKTLSLHDDIGLGGQARVARDLERCREVLVSLGFDPEAKAA